MKKIIAGFLPTILATILLAVLFLTFQADSAQANPSELHITTFETGKQPTFLIHVAVTGTTIPAMAASATRMPAWNGPPRM